MNISPDTLTVQRRSAAAQWPFLFQVERDHGLPRFLLFAVGSRETNLDPAFTEGKTGDGGHGHGLFQLDDRWHTIPHAFDTDPQAQAAKAAEMLAANYARHGDWVKVLNAYNSGQTDTAKTTGGDYGPDVWARRMFLESSLPPVDRTLPEPGSEGPSPERAPESAPNLLARPPVRAEAALLSLPTRSVAAVRQFFVENDGLLEYPDGSNHNWITQRCGLGDVPWCAETISLGLLYGGFGSFDEMVIEIGLETTYRWGWAFVPTIRRIFTDAGRWSSSPVVGALVIMFDTGHVGWCEEDLGDGTVLTREGNASNRLGQFRRSLADIDGFCLIPYDSAEEDDMFTEDDRNMLRFLAEYVENDRKKGGLDAKERFLAQVAEEHVSAIDQAGDGNRGLGWKRFIATLKGVRRPQA